MRTPRSPEVVGHRTRRRLPSAMPNPGSVPQRATPKRRSVAPLPTARRGLWPRADNPRWAAGKSPPQRLHWSLPRNLLGPLESSDRQGSACRTIHDGQVYLHNGNRVSHAGPRICYGDFSDILIINHGVHEPAEEFVFQQLLNVLRRDAVMLELGAYWGHYSMWLRKAKSDSTV